MRRYLLKQVYDGLRSVLRYWAGDEEYERYVRQCTAHRQPALDRGRYFAERLEETYKRAARCC